MGLCPFGAGVILGSDLPDSIKVGRTAPTASGFAGRELDRRDVLGCSDGVSLFLDDLGGFKTGGVDFGAASESCSVDLFVCVGL